MVERLGLVRYAIGINPMWSFSSRQFCNSTYER